MRLWISTENLRGVYYYSVNIHGVRSFRPWEKAPHPNPLPEEGRPLSWAPSAHAVAGEGKEWVHQNQREECREAGRLRCAG